MRRYVGLVLALLLLTGCGSESAAGRVEQQNAVDAVLQEQIELAQAEQSGAEERAEGITGETSADSADTSDAGSTDLANDEAWEQFLGGSMDATAPNGTDVDYDLTVMNSDMIYATVYQFMMDPFTYEGKTVRVRGQYYAAWFEPTQKYYDYCFIADAAACCQQGLEFEWGDGTHEREEFPVDNTIVEVEGTFTPYYEGEDLYCTLKGATMQVLGESAE